MRLVLALTLVVAMHAGPMRPAADGATDSKTATPRERRIAVGKTALYAREIGQGPPIIVLHGGPDFDHSYFLPDLDRWSDAYHLVYYDQRGRGKSGDRVQPEDVTLASEMADLDRVRQAFHLGAPTLVGHSWGSVLALEYAIRHPTHVGRLILMNPAPASASDFAQFRKAYAEALGADMERRQAVQASAGYQAGDPDAVAAYYRIHFKPALARPADLDKIVATLRASFTPERVLKARQVEMRLMNETWLASGYDLLPKLASLHIPTLVIYGDHDFIPLDTASHIAHAIPSARLVTLSSCGHFSYLECPDAVRKEIDQFFRTTRAH